MERTFADAGRSKKPETDRGIPSAKVDSQEVITGVYENPDTGRRLVGRDANSFFAREDERHTLRTQVPQSRIRSTGRSTRRNLGTSG